MNSTSVSLLQRLKSPNQQIAWQRFVDLYAPLIYYWARGQHLQANDSADLVQDVLAILVKKLPEFEYNPKQRFRGWLKTITVNKANDHHRKKGVRSGNAQGKPVENVSIGSNVDLFEEAEYHSFLASRALELMKSEFREETWQACWKQVVDGQSAAEVAEELGMSLNVAYLSKSRVLAKLREELNGLMD